MIDTFSSPFWTFLWRGICEIEFSTSQRLFARFSCLDNHLFFSTVLQLRRDSCHSSIVGSRLVGHGKSKNIKSGKKLNVKTNMLFMVCIVCT